jgi:P-type Cu+ transporter
MISPGAAPEPGFPHGTASESAARPVDPVCGMPVDEPAARREYRGRSYVFCSPHCLHRFQEQPDRFMSE